jgi:hypothetical protein
VGAFVVDINKRNNTSKHRGIEKIIIVVDKNERVRSNIKIHGLSNHII